MKKILFSIIVLISMVGNTVFASEIDENNVSTNRFLLETGMSQSEIDKIDPDIREYIVENLRENANVEELEFIKSEDVLTPELRVNQALSGISFTVSSWKSGSTIYIYPTYEFTTAKRPRGKDSFSVQFGNALRPETYGGKTWYKVYAQDSWESSTSGSDKMVANTQTMNGAEYSGTQLGTPDSKIFIKGCAYVYAYAGDGTDKRIIMSYMHNPNGTSYNLSFSAYGVGIQYSSSATIYTAAKTVTLSY